MFSSIEVNPWNQNYLNDDYSDEDDSESEETTSDSYEPKIMKRYIKREASRSGLPTGRHRSVDPTFQPYVRWCGSHETNMTRFDFVSSTNVALLNFHSDYSVSGAGFSLAWRAVPMTGCPTQTFTSSEEWNIISSPNYSNYLLNNLDCTYIIYAPTGRKVWLEFHSFDLLRESYVEIDLGNGPFIPYKKLHQLNDGTFASYSNRISIRLRTGSKPKGNGFNLIYKTSKYTLSDKKK